MLRNYGSHPRHGSRPGRVAATLVVTALLVSLIFPAQLLAAPAAGGTGSGASFGFQPWFDMLWSWLGLPPAPPVEEDGPKPTSLPGGCAADPLGNCLDTEDTDSESMSVPPETETSPETSPSG